jgi:hypothetical protein
MQGAPPPEDSPASSCGTSVRVRVRPRSSKESEGRCLELGSGGALSFAGPDGSRHAFTFDTVYGACCYTRALCKRVKG